MPTGCNAIVLNTDDPFDDARLQELRADARVEFIDNARQQQAGPQELLPPPPPDVTGDRNKNLITYAELDRLGQLRIGVVGLGVGHAIAYTLAAQGLCGEMRLADFDDLELSNLNPGACNGLRPWCEQGCGVCKEDRRA